MNHNLELQYAEVLALYQDSVAKGKLAVQNNDWDTAEKISANNQALWTRLQQLKRELQAGPFIARA